MMLPTPEFEKLKKTTSSCALHLNERLKESVQRENIKIIATIMFHFFESH